MNFKNIWKFCQSSDSSLTKSSDLTFKTFEFSGDLNLNKSVAKQKAEMNQTDRTDSATHTGNFTKGK